MRICDVLLTFFCFSIYAVGQHISISVNFKNTNIGTKNVIDYMGFYWEFSITYWLMKNWISVVYTICHEHHSIGRCCVAVYPGCLYRKALHGLIFISACSNITQGKYRNREKCAIHVGYYGYHPSDTCLLLHTIQYIHIKAILQV